MESLKLIVFSGLPGSGKSTLAEALANELSIPFFSVDPIESSIIKSGINRSFETGLAAYLVAQSLANEHLKLGISVIIDAVNSVNEARDMWRHLSNESSAKLIIVECILPDDIHKKRIESRVRSIHGIPEVSWQDVQERSKEYLPWEEKRLVVNTASPVENNLKKVLQYVSSIANGSSKSP
jgi:predicted kinase